MKPSSSSLHSHIPFTIENIVATGAFPLSPAVEKLDLTHMHHEYIDYNASRFPGAIIRFPNTAGIKMTTLFFATGKFVITGIRRIEEVDESVLQLAKFLQTLGNNLGKPTYTIQNFVSVGRVTPEGYVINLNTAVIALENAIYEPEVFPGMIYRHTNEQSSYKKAVFLIFMTGKAVCTGVKNYQHLVDAFADATKIIQDAHVCYNDIELEADGKNVPVERFEY